MTWRSIPWLAALALIMSSQPVRADNLEQLIELLRIEEDIQAQYDECIAGANRMAKSEIEHEFQDEIRELDFTPEDLALLIAIYTEFYNAGCDYLAGGELLNFYRGELGRRFSPGEIDRLIKFYLTPIGKKWNAEWLDINRVFGKVLQDRQELDSFEAQRRYERRMENFWLRLEERASEPSPEQGAAGQPPPGRVEAL